MNTPVNNAPSFLRDIDLQLSRQVLDYERSQGNTDSNRTNMLELAVQLLSAALGKGQVCLPLNTCPVYELKEQWQSININAAEQLSTCFTVFDASSEQVYTNQPLVLLQNRLYLARYYFYEQGVLQQIYRRVNTAEQVMTDEAVVQLANVLNGLFPPADNNTQPDWQKIAAATACVQTFSVITGGPGTGKTTTVTRLLAALLSQNPDLSIALAAPTGKAAARMTESIRAVKLQAGAALEHAQQIPGESFTLHRLLGWTPSGFRYNARHTLPYDCVVVDEASMVDLPMMFHLFNALPAHARLILLGDKDQLASVEAGSVLADLCDSGVQHGPSADFAEQLQTLTGFNLQSYAEALAGPVQNAVASLRVSHRFDINSGIGQLAAAINRSDAHRAAEAFRQYPDIHFYPDISDSPFWNETAWQRVVLDGYRDFCDAINQNKDATKVFAAFNQFQLLVALRQGPYGVEQVNLRTEQLLNRNGLLDTQTGSTGWYCGRPVMITRNDYDLGLFNGDIGIALYHTDGKGRSSLRIAFPDVLSEDATGVRWLLPSRLPAHETAFAMTVHKSQGSEFDNLCLLLPAFWQTVITRELIYTAITRSKKQFHVFSSEACWQQGVQTRVQRASGLREALWKSQQQTEL